MATQIIGQRVPAPLKIRNKAGTETTSIGAAFASLASTLRLASKTDETHSYSGDSDRLLRIAASLAGEASHNPPTDGNGAERIAFDIAALVIASRRVPGDTAGEDRKGHIADAKTVLLRLTDCEDVLQDDARCEALEAAASDKKDAPHWHPLFIAMQSQVPTMLWAVHELTDDSLCESAFRLSALAARMIERYVLGGALDECGNDGGADNLVYDCLALIASAKSTKSQEPDENPMRLLQLAEDKLHALMFMMTDSPKDADIDAAQAAFGMKVGAA